MATVKVRLEAKPELAFATDQQGKTPLHWAAWWGHKDVAELLLAKKADVNAKNADGDTPLHVAVSACSSDYSWVEEDRKGLAELLLANGADVNAENKHGWTPLYGAAGRTPAAAEFLRQHGGRITARVASVEEAFRIGGVEQVRALLKENPNVVFAKDTLGDTPLHWAALNGQKKIAELLLANKAEVNAWGDEGWRPLHLAACRGHREVAELLLANGADVNARNAHKWTPLHSAADAGCKGVVKLLLAQNADINAEDHARSTPLYKAVEAGHDAVADLLSQHGGNS